MRILFNFLLYFLFSVPAFAGVNNFSPTDNFLSSQNTSTNYSSNTSYGAPYTGDAYVMKYDLSSISGQTATYAHLNVWMNRGGQHNYTIYRVLQNLSTAQSTWNIYSTGNNWNTAGATGSGTDYTTTNSATYPAPGGAYQQVDITNSTMGETGDYIAQEDANVVQDFGNVAK